MINGFARDEIMKLIWEKPSLAQLKITNRCNQSCCFCYEGCDPKKNTLDLSINEWKLILKKLKFGGVYNLNFSGGEVFLYRDLKELLIYAKKAGFTNVVNTNGTIDVCDCLPYIDEIVFSVHGVGEIHNHIVNADSFNAIESNLAAASDSRVLISINMTIVKSNLDHIIDTYEYFNSKYNIHKFAPAIAVETEYGTKFSKEQKLGFSEGMFKKYFNILKSLPQDKLNLKHGLQVMVDNDVSHYELNNMLQSSYCIAGKSKLLIQANGDVYPCSFFEDRRYFCGNILYEDFSTIWNSGKGFIPFRSLILNNNYPKDCLKCVKLSRCSSGCRAWTQQYLLGEREEVFYGKDYRCKFANAFIGVGDNNKM